MRKRTARALLSAQRTVHKAMDILDRELKKLEKSELDPDLIGDINWVWSHLSEATADGMGHHIDDAEKALERRS
jgi:hypothetical protein